MNRLRRTSEVGNRGRTLFKTRQYQKQEMRCRGPLFPVLPGEDGDSLAQVGCVAAVDQGGPRVCLVRQGTPVGQALEVVAGKGLAGLDLDGNQFSAVIEEEVDFMAGRDDAGS